MFGWLKKRDKRPNLSPIDAIAILGQLIEDNPDAIAIDASRLPFPKYQMKAIVKQLYSTENDETKKQLLESAFMLLAFFQEGVGPKIIFVSFANDPLNNTQDFGDFLRWSARVSDEMQVANSEWNRFLEGEPI